MTPHLSLVYDQENDDSMIAVLASGKVSFADALQVIRDNNYEATEPMLVAMQRLYDQLTSLAVTAVTL